MLCREEYGRTIRAVFTAEGFSKCTTADFEKPLSSRSILDMLYFLGQRMTEREKTQLKGYEDHHTFRKIWQEGTITARQKIGGGINDINDIREEIMKLLLCCRGTNTRNLLG
jgi:hypothetical protein